jgi:hypothetical protein
MVIRITVTGAGAWRPLQPRIEREPFSKWIDEPDAFDH